MFQKMIREDLKSLTLGKESQIIWIPYRFITKATHTKGAFTLGVRDSRVESPNTMLAISDLNLVVMKILC
jgi:hypothetical protein